MSNLLEKAIALDLADDLKEFRARFSLPGDKVYLCSNSLGLPAKNAFLNMDKQMGKWANQGAHGWFSGDDAWYYSLNKAICRDLGGILGAWDNEVVVMNSLTVNLHLLLTSFYRPTGARFKIVMGEPVFPSDLYAIKSHIKLHGFDPEQALILLKPRENESILRIEDIERVIEQDGQHIALVYLSAASYLTGQILTIPSLVQMAHRQGCLFGLDLAHAAGNIPLHLHDDQVDFAVGCSYKYLCGGPGGPGIAYVHSSHHDKDLFRLAGWWGNDPKTRFQMDKLSEFVPFGGAQSWQVSTPSVLGLQPLLSSLTVFADAGMANLRKKSLLQTDFLLELLAEAEECYDIVTPFSPSERGNQISIKLLQPANEFAQLLDEKGFMCDVRPPNMLRVAPSPLYNSFQDIYRFVVDGVMTIRGVAT